MVRMKPAHHARDLRPFDWGQFLKDLTQIVSQIAVAAASLSVVTNHN